MKTMTLKSVALLSALAIGSLFVSCSDEDVNKAIIAGKDVNKAIVKKDLDNRPTEKEIINELKMNQLDSNSMVDMFLFSKKLTGSKVSNKGGSLGCSFSDIVEMESLRKFKYTFKKGCDFLGKKYEGSVSVETKLIGFKGYSKTLTFKGFFNGKVKLDGSTTFVVTRKNDKGNLEVSSTYDLTTTSNEGVAYSKKGAHKLERIEGGSTILRLKDDVYETSGEWVSKGKSGVYTVKITNNIVNRLDCLKGAVKGTLEITRGTDKGSADLNNKIIKKRVVDFGNGECTGKILLDGKELKL